MKWLQSLPYLALMGSGFMSCLGGGVAGLSRQTETSSVLLCWHQGRDLGHQRGETAFLALYLPLSSPWNSTNWPTYTVSPPSPPCIPFFSGAVGAVVSGPQSSLTEAGYTHTHPFLAGVQQGQQGIGLPGPVTQEEWSRFNDSPWSRG